MSSIGLWGDPLYQETVAVVLLFIAVVSGAVFVLKSKSPKFIGAWASVKSWIFVAPLMFACMSLPAPWPLVFLILISIYGSKTFYKMVGMYHRSWFVWVNYLYIFALGYIIVEGENKLYDISPMIFLGLICLIPLLRNSAKSMIQYIALSMMAFIFFGWCFLYSGRILNLENGNFIVIYLYILVEFSEAAALTGHRFFGRRKPFSNISPKASSEGILFALFFTLVLAWGLRHLLPDGSPFYWITAGLIASLGGRFGELIVAVVRRDLGIKDSGVFIIGRDDIIARMDKLIFVAPFFYFTHLFLNHMGV